MILAGYHLGLVIKFVFLVVLFVLSFGKLEVNVRLLVRLVNPCLVVGLTAWAVRHHGSRVEGIVTVHSLG